jgi:Ca-activated chloride channel family protein
VGELTFRWPAALWLLAVLPLLVVFYTWCLRQPSPRVVLHPQVAAIAAAAARGGRWRQHIPAILLGSVMTLLIVSMGRPVAPLPVPASNVYVVLSIDVSRSMLAQDIRPSRIEAAKMAAMEFVRVMPREARIGLVTFSSYATLLVPPTLDHERVIRAIEGLTVEFATAIGDGLLEAVYALPGRPRPRSLSEPPLPPQGRLPPGTVVLMSDGQNNRGVSPLEAARIARDLQVKVYTVGIGTPEGTWLDVEGRGVWVALDEETLRGIAEITGGSYFHVSSARDLYRTYRALGRLVGWERKPTEVTGLVCAAAAVLLAGTLVFSVARVYRMPEYPVRPG